MYSFIARFSTILGDINWAVLSSVAYPDWMWQLFGSVIAWQEGEAIKNVLNCIYFGLSMKSWRGGKKWSN